MLVSSMKSRAEIDINILTISNIQLHGSIYTILSIEIHAGISQIRVYKFMLVSSLISNIGIPSVH